MPNWKKVIVSGSNAVLSSITNDSTVAATNITGSFTGSFVGDGNNLDLSSNTSISTTPFPFAGDGIISGSLLISSSNSTASLTLEGSGSTVFSVQGSQGQLFSLTDDLLHDNLVVGDISGDTIFKVSGSGLVTIPIGDLSGSATATASYGSFSGSFQGDGSGLTNLNVTTPTLDAVTTAGNVTSNAITAGTISGSAFKLNNANALSHTGNVLYVGNANDWTTVELGRQTTDEIHVNGILKAEQNITASANISASGYVSASAFAGDGNSLTNISSTSLNGIGIGLSTVVGDGASSAASYGNAFGKSATSTGGQNVAVGAFSNVKYGGVSIGQSTAGGNYTVAIGNDVGNTNGEYNVLIGDRAGNNSSGDYNISLGYLAGYNQTSGNGNITIGSGSQGVAGESNQLRIGHGLHGALISGSLSDGGVMIRGQVSASSYIGDGSGLTNLPTATAGSTSGRVVFTTTNGELTTEAGFTYDATTDRLTVPNLTTTTFTSSFITSSQIHTSGSNIFGDDTTDTQTLIGTTKMTGSAQITGSLEILSAASRPPVKIYNSGTNTLVSFGDSSTRFQIPSSGTATMVGFNMYSGILAGTLDGGSQVINKLDRLELGGYGFGGTSVIGMVSPAGTVTVPGNGFAMYPDDANGAGTVSPHFKTEDGSILTLATTSSLKRVTADSSKISGSGGLSVESSGSTVFEVIGSEGTLFSIDDDLDGVIFTANDRSGLPVLEASASGEVYIGKSPQSLYTTAVISSNNANVTQSIYGLDTSSYGGAFFEYTAHSGSNARAGNIMSVWNGSSLNFTETTTTDIGSTSDLVMKVHISQSQAQLAAFSTTAGYNIKTIIKSI